MQEPFPHALLAPERVRYHSLPTPRAAADYEEALGLYVEQVRRLPGVLGIASFGTVAAPGLSDLDVLVVTEPRLPRETAEGLDPEGLPPAARALFVHPPFVVPADGVRHVLEHLDWPPLALRWGEIPPAPPGEDRALHRTATVIEKLATHLALFSRTAHARTADVRAAFPLLYSVRYSLDLAAHLLAERREPWGTWAQELYRLRAGWFALTDDGERTARLAASMASGWAAVADACFRVQRRLDDQAALPCLSGGAGKGVYALGGWEGMVPLPLRSADTLLEAYAAVNAPAPARWRRGLYPGRRRLERFHWLAVPEFHRALILATVAYAGEVGRQLARARVTGKEETFSPRSALEQSLAERARRMGEQAEYLRRNGLGFGGASSGLTWLPDGPLPHGRGWKRRLLWRISLSYTLPRLESLSGDRTYVEGE